MSFKAMYLFCLAGISMHGILDAMTNYGTHLFWPFINRRESWSIISIIDPIFTLVTFVFLLCAFYFKHRKYALIGAVFAMSYWSLGLYQREQATDAMYERAKTRGHMVERFEVKPSIGNILVWRGQYMYKGNIYYDAFHTSPWRGNITYQGGHLPIFVPPKNISEIQKRDLDYFSFFSDGWLSEAPDSKGLVGDMRFSMLPHQPGPLWGIRLQPKKPDSHVLFENIRIRQEGDIKQLWSMIKGEAKE
jgi:inner membrane protein